MNAEYIGQLGIVYAPNTYLVEPHELVIVAIEATRPLVQLLVLSIAVIAPRMRHERMDLSQLCLHCIGVEGRVGLVVQQSLPCEGVDRLCTEELRRTG